MCPYGALFMLFTGCRREGGRTLWGDGWHTRPFLHSGRTWSKTGRLMSCITDCFKCSCFKPLLLKRHMSPVTLLVFHGIPYQTRTQCQPFSLLLDGFKTTDVLFPGWQNQHGWFISDWELALGACVLDLLNIFSHLLSVHWASGSANLPSYTLKEMCNFSRHCSVGEKW